MFPFVIHCICNHLTLTFHVSYPINSDSLLPMQRLSTLKHQMRMLDGRIWDFSPEKPYHDISDFWDGEVPESNLE